MIQNIIFFKGKHVVFRVGLVEGNAPVKLLVVKGVDRSPKFGGGFHVDCSVIFRKLQLKEGQMRAMEIALVAKFAGSSLDAFCLCFCDAIPLILEDEKSILGMSRTGFPI